MKIETLSKSYDESGHSQFFGILKDLKKKKKKKENFIKRWCLSVYHLALFFIISSDIP